MAIKRNSEGKIILKRFSASKLQRAAEDYNGFCRHCGHEQGECEPDARRYECESCGGKAVYGAEELMLMGAFTGAMAD